MQEINDLAQITWKQLQRETSAYKFIHSLARNADIYIFGGLVRDFLANKLHCIRDFDFVVKFHPDIHIEITKFIPKLSYVKVKMNRYGGYKINFTKCITIDIWELEDTWAFRKGTLVPSVENLLDTVYLNIDAFVYSLNRRCFIKNCNMQWDKIIKKGIIDIVSDKGPFEELNLLRALFYCDKYRMQLSERIRLKFRSYEEDHKSFISKLLELQLSHFGYIRYQDHELESKIGSICSREFV